MTTTAATASTTRRNTVANEGSWARALTAAARTHPAANANATVAPAQSHPLSRLTAAAPRPHDLRGAR